MEPTSVKKNEELQQNKSININSLKFSKDNMAVLYTYMWQLYYICMRHKTLGLIEWPDVSDIIKHILKLKEKHRFATSNLFSTVMHDGFSISMDFSFLSFSEIGASFMYKRDKGVLNFLTPIDSSSEDYKKEILLSHCSMVSRLISSLLIYNIFNIKTEQELLINHIKRVPNNKYYHKQIMKYLLAFSCDPKLNMLNMTSDDIMVKLNGIIKKHKLIQGF